MRVCAVLLVGMAVYLGWAQSLWWSTIDEFSFGYLIPLFIGYVLFERWEPIKAHLIGENDGILRVDDTPSRLTPLISALAVIAVVGGIVAYLLGGLIWAKSRPSVPASLMLATGFASALLGLAWVYGERSLDGQRHTLASRIAFVGLFVFPAIIWFVGAPMLFIVENQLKLLLLEKVTIVVVFVFELLGLVIERQENLLILPSGIVGVEDACSGIRSLTACIFCGSFLAAVFFKPLWKKLLLLVMAVVLAFVTNVMRSLFLTGWAYEYGPASIEGSVHDITGYAVLGLTTVLLLCLVPLLNFKLEWDEDDAP